MSAYAIGSTPAADGWTSAGETWTYASATTFTVTGDQTAKYSKGTRIKLTQTTTKYFVVVGSSHSAGTTTVTITGGTTYTFANAAVTDPYYSYAVNPQGYPDVFNYTPTYSSTGTPATIGNGTIAGEFSMVGKRCHVTIRFTGGSSTSFGTGTMTFSLPINARTGVGMLAGAANVVDASGGEYDGSPFLNSASVVGVRATKHDVGLQYVTNTTPMNWVQTDSLALSAIYEVAA